MEIEIKKDLNNVVVKIVGRLDTGANAEFSNKMDEVLHAQPASIEFDCEEMVYVASSGLRTFLNTYKHLAATNGKLKLTHVQPAIMGVLEMTGFTSFLSIE